MSEAEQWMAYVLERAAERGALADVIVSCGDTLSLRAENGALGQRSVSQDIGISIRVVKDQRVGVSYSQSIERHQLDRMVEQAIGNASISRIDEFQDISAMPVSYAPLPDTTYQTDTASLQDKIEAALYLEQRLADRMPGTSAPYNGLTDATREVYVTNSHGVYAHHRERSLSCYTSALLTRDAQKSSHMSMRTARTFDGLDVEACADEAFETAEALLDGQPIATGHYDVVMGPDVFRGLLGVFQPFSGVMAMKGLSVWSKKQGTSVASSVLNVHDDPLRPDGLLTRTFDDEGVAKKPRTLLADGVLQTFLHNRQTAQYFGVDSTGHGRRGLRDTLDVSRSHLVIEVDTEGADGVYHGRCVDIVGLEGLHAGANAITGAFSLKATGFLVENGVPVQPIRGITVAGNFFELLQNIQSASTSSRWDHRRSVWAPDIRFSGCTIAGK
ncbi:MAG: TldD/PmbA family protein [Myxococcota bacterium]|nr:TldD/PmbA family protein [Myxococcota bacterium]